MNRPASRASRYCVIPLSSRAVTRIFPNGHGEGEVFLLIFFQAHQPIHFVQQVTGRNAKPPSKTNDHLGSRLEFSSLFRYSSAIPVLLASWYCDIWRDSRILTSAAPNRHCFTFPIFYRKNEFNCGVTPSLHQTSP